MSNLSAEAPASSSTAPHPRLPGNLRLGAVHIVVTGLDRSVDFYERSIGLQLRIRDGGRAFLGAGAEDLLVLHERPDAKRAGSHAGLYHFALLYPTRRELGRAVRRLAATGTPIQGASDHGISEAIYLPDPDGNGIELAADRSREHWGDLRDPTTIGPKPIDLAGLVESVASEGLTERADRDLRVGHLHLHVGDLDEALDFYRDLIGFDVMTHFDSAAFVAAGGYHHHLGLNTWKGAGAPPPPADAVGLRRWTVLIDADGTEALRERLADAGVAVEVRSDGILARDPWGMATLFRADGGPARNP